MDLGIWELFLQMIRLKENPFLDNISTLIRAFAAVVRKRHYKRTVYINLVERTKKNAMDKVADVFRAKNRNDPKNGKNKKKDLQYKSN